MQLQWKTLVWFCLSALYLTGCAHPSPHIQLGRSGPISLDSLVAKEEALRRIQQAEQDLPDDSWKAGGESHPVIRNVSRFERETELAHELLRSIRPKLQELSAQDLINSLKTTPPETHETASGVACLLYLTGNLAIIEELASRSRRDLECLRGLQSDGRLIFTGDSARNSTIGELVRFTLLPDAP